MKLLSNKILFIVIILFSVYGYIAGCTHKDLVLPQQASTVPVISFITKNLNLLL